ncbi:MAG: MBL fold metallo-hydrolase [Acidimicrobiia bacterium]|nr:MBL fold metallo-hydrolase [Acidimicrobiia bacterium]
MGIPRVIAAFVCMLGVSLAAQQRPPLDVVQVAPQVYLLAGDGGNIAVQHGPDGVVLVDSGAGQRSDDVLAALKPISALPIRYILNTSANAEHVGGNGRLSQAGEGLGGGGGGGAAAVISGVRTGAARLAHENVLLRMSAPLGQKAPFPEAAWPTEAFIDRKNLYLNGEAIQILHVPSAHSDGDSVVFFRRSDVIVAGAVVDITRFPVIEVSRGGSIQGEIDALNFILELAIPPTPLVWHPGGTQIIPARGRVLEHADVVEYRDMVTVVRDVVRDLIEKGMTREQIRAAEPTRGYTRRYGSTTGPWTTEMFVDAVYASLTKGATR